MKIILKEKNKYLLRFDPGEEAMEGLKNFCLAEKVRAGWFWGIGTARELTLSFYDIAAKEYRDKSFGGEMEIAGISGNVAERAGETIIHCHGVFSDSEMKSVAGHVKKITILATCEIFFEKFESSLKRQYDEETGLNLLA